MTTVHDYVDYKTPFLTVPEKFQVGVYTVTAEVYGNHYEQFPVIHITSYEPFLVTPDVEIRGDIVFTDEGEHVWISRIQVSVHGGIPIPFDAASYDLPEISAQIRVYLANLFRSVWTNDVGYLIAYAVHNKLTRPIGVRFSTTSSKVSAATKKIEETEKLIASLPELVAARDAIIEEQVLIRGEYQAIETLYKEKVRNLPSKNEVETEIIYPSSVFTENKIVQEAVVPKKRWWK